MALPLCAHFIGVHQHPPPQHLTGARALRGRLGRSSSWPRLCFHSCSMEFLIVSNLRADCSADPSWPCQHQDAGALLPSWAVGQSTVPGQSQGFPWDQRSHSTGAVIGASTVGNHPIVYKFPWPATPILPFLPSFPSH